MGFLSGAYGKLMAGKMVRSLQYEMTMVQSQLRRITRQVGDMEKFFSAKESSIKAQMQAAMNGSVFKYGEQLGINPQDPSSMSKLDQSYITLYNNYQQQQQQQFMMAQSAWQNTFEMMREAMLQPLKDTEDQLQTQKDNLESRLKIAQAEYDAKKEEEKAGAKNLAPDYTGQG